MSSSDKLQDILNQVDPELVIDDLGSDYRRQTGRSGEQLNIKECPRCGGNSWKVFLNAETGLGNCFHGSCVGQPGFNLFSFARHSLGSPKAAMELLEAHAGRMGWRPKRKRKDEPQVIETWNEEIQLPRSVALPYRNSIGNYLKGRGFKRETVEYFHWRFSQDGMYGYASENAMRYQSYARRILIPIFDLSGKLVTFQGRDITGIAEKKYLFPPGLPGTSLYLYNGHNAVGAEEIIVNEGALDVAATYQAFQEDPLLRDVPVVGTFGKVVSMGRQKGDDQLGALLTLKERGLRRITMMWDSEPKTLRDAAAAAHKLSQYGFDARVAILPPGMDPNEAKPVEVREAYRGAVTMNTKIDHLRFLASRAAT